MNRHKLLGLLSLLACGSACTLEDASADEPGASPSSRPVACNRAAVIEDGENNDHQVIVHSERNGYIYTFINGSTKVEPTAGADGGTFTMSRGGANGSQYAARMRRARPVA